MSETTDKQESKAEENFVYDVLPGADAIEQPENVDLSFDTEPETETTAETTEEPVAEADDSPETEEETKVDDEVEVETTEEEPETEESEPEVEETPVETEVEEESEPLAAKTEEPETKSPMVPKSRLDEVLAKQKALQKQLDEATQAAAKPADAPEEYDFDAKEIEYQTLVLDGEAEKAVALRKEIRAAEKSQIAWEMEQKMGQTVQQSQAEVALQAAAEEMETKYPVFNQNSSDYNEEYTNEVVELRDAFIIKGYNAVDALTRAVRYVVKDHGIGASGEVEQKPALAETKPDQTAKKKATVAKKLKAAEAQPPELEGESSSSRGENVVDLTKISEDEFNALPEATIRRLRGDIV